MTLVSCRFGVIRNFIVIIISISAAIVQAISIIFSLVQMAIIAESYQRFESQKIVGRNYPWCPNDICEERRRAFQQRTILATPTTPSARTIPNLKDISAPDEVMPMEYGESPKLNELSKPFTRRLLEETGIYNIELAGDPEPIEDQKKTFPAYVDRAMLLESPVSRPSSVEDDTDARRTDIEYRKRSIGYKEHELKPGVVSHTDNNYYNTFDTSPTSPPPPLPQASALGKILNYPLYRLSTMADMILLDSELYVKDHVPRLPKKISEHEFKSHHMAAANGRSEDVSPEPLNSISGPWNSEPTDIHRVGADFPQQDCNQANEGEDVVDGNVLMMPRRRKMIVGLDQDDFFAKTVGFMGWTFFILARVLSISVFALLYWRETIYVCLGHYLLVLACLLIEVKFHAKAQRNLFYLFLSYVYIFVIIEFKIKFIHLRMWYGLYVGLVFTQNFVLSVWWYTEVMDFELWWYDYLFRTILGSGFLSLCCLLVYYFRLKPKDKVLFQLMDETDQELP